MMETILIDPYPGDPKTYGYGSYGSGSAEIVFRLFLARIFLEPSMGQCFSRPY
jgi:hypothetical protein